MKPNRKWLWPVIGLAILVIVWQFQPTANEPVYHGRTVTKWLDGMALFDGPRHMGEDGRNSSYKLPDSPGTIQNDPSLQALLALGSKAVPILEKTLSQPPQWPPGTYLDRLEASAKWEWERVRNSGTSPPPPSPQVFSNFQEARKMAAGLGLLALGTNHNAGALRLIEVTAAGPRDALGRLRMAYFESFILARIGLPERHGEIVAGILAALNHTNASCQLVAITATKAFPMDLPIWRNPLMKLAEGSDPAPRQSALWALACLDPKDSEIMALCEKTLQDQTNPARLRSLAAAGLGMAEDKATNALPLLREVLTETGLPSGSGLQREARTAIESIEKAAAANAKSAAPPKER